MKVVDLFCGAGGFTLGAHAAGFSTALALDIDSTLSSPIARCLPSVRLEIASVADLPNAFIVDSVGRPDGIIGGPPCQGFSEIGRNDPLDPRNELVSHFYRHVAAAQPRFFVMENVRGILRKYGREILDKAIQLVEPKYEIIGPVLINANRHGAPTTRPRVIVVGVHREERVRLNVSSFSGVENATINVHAAIGDLRTARQSGTDALGFDRWSYGSGRPSAYAARMRLQGTRKLTEFSGHARTVHSDAVIDRFNKVAQGKTDSIGRHPRLSNTGVCPTLRAGTGSDRGSYQSVRPIHPIEDRVITVREAARLQGFPDWYDFHPTVWHSFRMIGNRVPPPVSESILRTVRDALAGSVRPEA